MTGKTFESYLKEKDTEKKTKEEKEKEGNTAKKIQSKERKDWMDRYIRRYIEEKPCL